MLRLAFITFEFPPDSSPGGIGTYTLQTVEMLADTFDIHIFCASNYREGKRMITTNNNYHYNLCRLKCASPEEFQQQVVNAVCDEHSKTPFHLIECAEINANGLLVKQVLPGIPVVVRLHGPSHLVEKLKKSFYPMHVKLRYTLGCIRLGNFNYKRFSSYQYYKDPDYMMVRCADAISAPTESMRNWAEEVWNISKNSIEVFPNCVSPKNIRSDVYEKKQILFFGRLNVLKGVVGLTKAMKNILHEFPTWRFTVVGDDSNFYNGESIRDWMKAQLTNAAHQVTFYNALSFESLSSLIAESKIIVLPSLFESFSYACVEAMCFGKAIVGGTIGGMKDLLNNGAGCLVNPYKPKQIQKAVRFLIENPSERERMAQKAKHTASQFQSIALKQRYTSFYTEIVNGARKN